MLNLKIIRLACLLSVSIAAILISATTSFSQETSLPYFVKSLQSETKPKTQGSQVQTDFRNSDASLDQEQVASTTKGSAANNPTVLSPKEKMKLGFKNAFWSPGNYAFSFISAAITEADEHDQPGKTTEDRVVDGFSRWARNVGNGASKSLLVDGALPAILHEDPRYHPSELTGFRDRTKYAISRVFVAQKDDGSLQPNYSRLLGSLAASGLDNIWEHNTPDHRRIGVEPTFSRFGWGIGFDVVQFVVLKEFGPDIKKKLFHH
jgi:hypothetical protein